MVGGWYFVVAVLLVVACKTMESVANEECVDLDGFFGRCIKLSKCGSLSDIYQTPVKTILQSQRLADSLCGRYKKNPLVCCLEGRKHLAPEINENHVESSPAIGVPYLLRATDTTKTASTSKSTKIATKFPSTTTSYFRNMSRFPIINKLLRTTTISTAMTTLSPLEQQTGIPMTSTTHTTKTVLASKSTKNPTRRPITTTSYPRSTTRFPITPTRLLRTTTMSSVTNPRFPMTTSYPLEPQVDIQRTDLDEFPWSALIQYRKAHGILGFHCGGSLIHERYVLTAAHCINAVPRTWEVSHVRLGEYDIRNPGVDCVDGVCADWPVDVAVEQVLVHENYTTRQVSQYHDIALIRLMEDVSITAFLRPIPLPTSEMDRFFNMKAMAIISAGWGRTTTASASSVKMKVQLDLDDLNVCAEAYKLSGAKLRDTQLCASEWRDTGICSCDSGGPLMAHWDGQYYLLGIVSFGPAKCGLKNAPGVYTNVMKYVDWIKTNMDLA